MSYRKGTVLINAKNDKLFAVLVNKSDGSWQAKIYNEEIAQTAHNFRGAHPIKEDDLNSNWIKK